MVNLDLAKKVLVLYLVQAKGGYSHDVWVSKTKWFHKPSGACVKNRVNYIQLKFYRKQSITEAVCRWLRQNENYKGCRV